MTTQQDPETVPFSKFIGALDPWLEHRGTLCMEQTDLSLLHAFGSRLCSLSASTAILKTRAAATLIILGISSLVVKSGQCDAS